MNKLNSPRKSPVNTGAREGYTVSVSYKTPQYYIYSQMW